MSYKEWKRKLRKKKPLSSHSGTPGSYVERVQNAAGEYGATSKTRAALDYANNLYDLAFDPRMLNRAYKDQKGYAAGIDGVPVEDLWRQGAHVEWCNACEIPFKKQPPYNDTIFPTAPARAIALLSILYDPDHDYRLKGLSFSGNRAAFQTLLEMGPLCSQGEADKLVEKFQGSDPLHYQRYGDLCQKVSAEANPEMLLNAGLTEAGLVEAVDAVGKAIRKSLEAATYARIKDKVESFTPLAWLENEEAAEMHLTWKMCRWISGLMQGSGYRPKPLRPVEIPKGDGGVRVLKIPTVIDRTLERAAFMTLEPMLEKKFRPNSVGCRNDLDRFDALAALYNHYPNARGRYILCADIKKAFDNVVPDILLACLEKHVPNRRMMRYLEKVIMRPGANRDSLGIHQGGPLSPMFLNVLLHDRLDIPFLKMLRSDLLYIRYVDDLAVFGFESKKEGEVLIELLQRILKPISLELHTQAPKTQIVDLSNERLEIAWDDNPAASLSDGVGVDRYLGLGLHGNAEGRLEFLLPRSWPERIADMYRRADANIAKCGYSGSEGAYTHIYHATASWLEAFAPAWREEWQHEVTERIVEISATASQHGGMMKSKELAKVWEDSYKRWVKFASNYSAAGMMGWVHV